MNDFIHILILQKTMWLEQENRNEFRTHCVIQLLTGSMNTLSQSATHRDCKKMQTAPWDGEN